jgi:hypothetical protein
MAAGVEGARVLADTTGVTPAAMKLFLILATAVVVFVTASQALPLPSGCHFKLMPLRCARSEPGSNIPEVKDVRRVIDAAYRDHLDETLAHLYATVNLAQTKHKGTSEWAFAIEEGVPGLAQRVGQLTDRARLRVAAAKVDTEAGQRFRTLALRGLRLQGIMYRAFAHDLVSRRPTLSAFNRWGIRVNAMHRWYLAHFAPILAAAPAKDRAAVKAALLEY